jgi:hypothetical protein
MSRVPGTFKNRPPEIRRDLRPEAAQSERDLELLGAVVCRRYLLGECTVIVALEPYGTETRWHLSIAHSSRYPTWDEIKAARYGISDVIPDSMVMAQLLGPVAEGEWVNAHDNCFHLYEVRDPVWS